MGELGLVATPAGGRRAARLSVLGMTCGSCVATLERAASAAAGTLDISVSLERKEAVVGFLASQQTAAGVAAAMQAAGRKVTTSIAS